MSVYAKWAGRFGIPASVAEKVGEITEKYMEMKPADQCKANMLNELIGEFAKEVGSLEKEMLANIFMAISLYSFLSSVERRIKEVGWERAESFLNNAFELESFRKSITFPPYLHHPSFKTAWEILEPALKLRFGEIVRDLIQGKV
jgi:hypothetical protein